MPAPIEQRVGHNLDNHHALYIPHARYLICETDESRFMQNTVCDTICEDMRTEAPMYPANTNTLRDCLLSHLSSPGTCSWEEQLGLNMLTQVRTCGNTAGASAIRLRVYQFIPTGVTFHQFVKTMTTRKKPVRGR